MSRVLVRLLPGAVFLFPDNHFPVIGAGGQDIAIHGVGPGHLPHWPFMTAGEKVTDCSDRPQEPTGLQPLLWTELPKNFKRRQRMSLPKGTSLSSDDFEAQRPERLFFCH